MKKARIKTIVCSLLRPLIGGVIQYCMSLYISPRIPIAILSYTYVFLLQECVVHFRLNFSSLSLHLFDTCGSFNLNCPNYSLQINCAFSARGRETAGKMTARENINSKSRRFGNLPASSFCHSCLFILFPFFSLSKKTKKI